MGWDQFEQLMSRLARLREEKPLDRATETPAANSPEVSATDESQGVRLIDADGSLRSLTTIESNSDE